MSALTRSAGRVATMLAALLVVLLTTAAGQPGVRPGTAEGAELVKTGWWWAANETPLDSTDLAPPQPSPPNVPKGSLPVSAANGEPEKFSALEFRLDAEPGGVVESAQLVLRESAEPGANLNAEGAKILACPVTESFWADGSSAAWKARPAYDCDLASAAGTRDAKTGLWHFDLVAVASLWTAEGHTGSTSLVLVEGAEAPESFQVAFDGPAEKGLGFAFDITDAEAPAPLTPPGNATGAGTSGAVTTSSGGDSGSVSGSMPSSGSAGTGSLGEASAAAPVDVPAAEAAPAPQAAATAPVSAPLAAPPWYAGIPRAGYLLLPLTLGLAYLLMLALGPDAQPAAAGSQHGVGRALERLKVAGGSVGAVLTQRGSR